MPKLLREADLPVVGARTQFFDDGSELVTHYVVLVNGILKLLDIPNQGANLLPYKSPQQFLSVPSSGGGEPVSGGEVSGGN